jgi:hypothetical protein
MQPDPVRRGIGTPAGPSAALSVGLSLDKIKSPEVHASGDFYINRRMSGATAKPFAAIPRLSDDASVGTEPLDRNPRPLRHPRVRRSQIEAQSPLSHDLGGVGGQERRVSIKAAGAY